MLSPIQFWRLSLVVFSAFIWISSMFLYYSQVVNHSDSDIIEMLFNNDSYYVALVLVLSCCTVVSVVGIVGCWGALDAKHLVLRGYFALLVIVVLLEIIAIVFIFMWNKTLEGDIIARITTAVKQFKMTDSVDSEALGSAQTFLECCGANSYLDWLNSSWWASQRNINTSFVVPETCCKDHLDGCNFGYPPYTDVAYKDRIWTQGCTNVTIRLAKDQRNKLTVAATGFSVLYSGGIIATGYVMWIMR